MPEYNRNRGPTDSDDYNIHDENVQLFETVVRYSRLATRKQPETLLLFGLSGSGKTSIVNTIYNELTSIPESALQAGSGSTQTKTLDFKWYVNCGILQENIIDSDLQSKIGAIIGSLPNIIDCAGKGNVNDEQAKEILRHTLTGRIPPRTSIAALEELQNKKGVGCLNVVLPPCNPEWAVTKVIFVQSAADSIPEQLLDMLHDVLSEHDDRLQTKFKASLFTVITKHDLVKEAGRDLYGSDQDATITAQDFQDKKDKLATALRIKNNVGDNCIPWASYCDTVRMPSPKLRLEATSTNPVSKTSGAHRRAFAKDNSASIVATESKCVFYQSFMSNLRSHFCYLYSGCSLLMAHCTSA